MKEQRVSLAEKAIEWKVGLRSVQSWCKDGRIPGAIKVGKNWYVPSDAVRPTDSRFSEDYQAYEKEQRMHLKMSFGDVQLLSNLSRDIRTQLSSVLGYSEKIASLPQRNAEVDLYAGIIHDSGERILNLVNMVEDLARFSGGEVVPVNHTVRIVELMKRSTKAFEGEAKRRGIKLDIKAEVKHSFIRTDVEIMESIFNNILSNAIRYTPDGGKIEILVEELDDLKEGKATFKYTIKDTGIGMTPAKVESIFELVPSEHDAEDEKRGFGLGMPITYRMVSLLEGTITVKSIIDYGTRVTVELKQEVENRESTQEMESRMSDIRVLVAEDNELNREILKEVLTEFGCKVCAVKDGIDCLTMINAKPSDYFNLVIMDLQMPNMDGVTTTKIIRGLTDEKKAALPIVAMTANVMIKDRENAREAGMDEFLEKPINRDRLYATIKRNCLEVFE